MTMAPVKLEPGARFELASSTATYTYSSLADNDIRLVKVYFLRPEDGPRGNRATPVSPLCIDLVHTSLSEAPSFAARSYTWSDQQNCNLIVIDKDKTDAATV